MRRPAPALRLLLSLFATVQVAAPVAATLADASFAASAQWLGLHIEDHSSGPRDHPPHQDDCVFCQFLGHHAAATERGVRQPAGLVVVGFGVATPQTRPHAVSPLLHDSRAPPVA